MKTFVKFCKDLGKKNVGRFIFIKGDRLYANDLEFIGTIKLNFDITNEHSDGLYGLNYDRFLLLNPESKDDIEYKDGGVYIKGNFMKNEDAQQVREYENQGIVLKIKDGKRLDFISKAVSVKNFSPILTYVCLRNGTAYGTDGYEIREASDVYEGGDGQDYLIDIRAFKYGEIEAIRYGKFGTVKYKDTDFMLRFQLFNGRYPEVDYDKIVGTETKKHITRGNELPEYKGKFDRLAFKYDEEAKKLKVSGIKGTDRVQIGETAIFGEGMDDTEYQINYKYWNEKKMKGDFTYEIIETNHGVFMWKRQHGVKTLIRVVKN